MMEAAEIEAQVMMAASENAVDVYDDTTDADAEMGNGRRGSWGSLWN